METFKQALSVIGAVVGLLTALLPLYARWMDKKKNAARAEEHARRVHRRRVARRKTATHDEATVAVAEPLEALEEEITPEVFHEEIHEEAHGAVAARNSANVARARALVKAPGTALLVLGCLGIAFNLIMVVFGFVDTFVTPLSADSRNERAQMAQAVATGVNLPQMLEKRDSNQASSVLAIITFFMFAIASGMAAWAGFNMRRLKSYWLSMAGSIAVMPAGCFCFFAGMPVGIWSVVTLLRPEVSSSFN